MNYDGKDSLKESGGAGLSDADARALLSGIAPPAHAADMPPRDSMLTTICEPAAVKPQSPPVVRRLLAAAALAVVALVLFFAWQGWRGGHPQQQASPLLAPDTAWASVDGVVLEYEFVSKCVQRRLAAGEPSVDDQVGNVVDDLAQRYASLNPPGHDFPVVYVDSGRAFNLGPLAWQLQRIVVATDDDALLAELDKRIQQISGVWGPRRFNETLFYNEKYPKLCFPGRLMIIDGKQLRIPQDLNHSQMFHLSTFHKEILEQEPGVVMYYAHLRLSNADYAPVGAENSDPLHLGDVVRISVNPDASIVLDTVAEKASFKLAEKYMSSGTTADPDNPEKDIVTRYMPTVSVQFAPGELPPDLDPIAALQAEYDRYEKRDEARQDPTMQSYLYFYMLFPEVRLRKNLNEEVTAEERAWSTEVAASAKKAAGAFADAHDDIFVSDRGYKRCYSMPLKVGDDLVVMLRTGIRTSSPKTAAEFKQAMEDATGLTERVYVPPDATDAAGSAKEDSGTKE